MAEQMATTLVELLGQRVAAEPDTPYLHVYDETVSYGALWRESARDAAGLRPVPIYPTLGVEATANVCRHSEAKAVATIGWFRKDVEESQAGASNHRHVLEPQDLEVDDASPAFPAVTEDDVAFIQYTSG